VDPETFSADLFILRTSRYDKVDEFKDGKITFDLGPCIITFDFGEIFKE
jgi:hypothetical protein